MVIGAFFFVASSYVLFRDAILNQGPLLGAYHNSGWLAFAYMLFYALAGLFTTVFHGAYLAVGRPPQGIAGVAALGVAALLTAMVVGLISLAA
jgi:hypothetical protein